MSKIGILAYGSLIDFPGEELEPLIENRIKCITPFKVEYARMSKKRGNGPTVIPNTDIGKEVGAIILVLNDSVNLEDAKSMLWRREIGVANSEKKYKAVNTPTVNKVVVNTIHNYKGIQTVLYTKIGKNIPGELTAKKLAILAIKSLKTEAGKNGEDGVTYLLNNNRNGIVTELSKEYENEILKITNCDFLEEVIESFSKDKLINNKSES